MKKTINIKNNKGITLVALVITIIVLLILAMVSISLVMNSGIIEHANNAVTRYNEAQINEMEKLNDIADQISNIGKPTTNWWIPTEEEEGNFMDGGGYGDEKHKIVAMNPETGEAVTVFSCKNQNEMIMIMKDDPEESIFYYPISDEGVNIIGEGQEIEVSKFKWYSAKDAMVGSKIKEYTGEFPISVEGLTQVFSQSYLTRVINSFK